MTQKYKVIPLLAAALFLGCLLVYLVDRNANQNQQPAHETRDATIPDDEMTADEAGERRERPDNDTIDETSAASAAVGHRPAATIDVAPVETTVNDEDDQVDEDDVAPDEPVVFYHKNGQRSLEFTVGDGANTGRVRTWHENGLPAAVVEMRDGRRHGLSRSWHRNGEPAGESNYVNGEKDGESVTRLEDGGIWEIAHYAAGVRDGEQRLYGGGDESGSIHYQAGKRLTPTDSTNVIIRERTTASADDAGSAAAAPADDDTELAIMAEVNDGAGAEVRDSRQADTTFAPEIKAGKTGKTAGDAGARAQALMIAPLNSGDVNGKTLLDDAFELQYSRLQYDSVTGNVSITATLINVSLDAISSPFYFGFENMTHAGVIVADSYHDTALEVGPFIRVDKSVLPGESVDIELEFRNTGLARFTFEPSLYAVSISVTIDAPADLSLTNQTNVVVAGSITSNVAVVTVNGTPGVIEGSEYSASVPVTEGENSIAVTALGISGGVVSGRVDVTRDTVPPVISIAGVEDGLVTNQAVTPLVDIDDDTVIESAIELNDEPFQSGTPVTTDGAYTLSVSATDPAGNTASEVIAFALDKSAPVVTVTSPAPDTDYSALAVFIEGIVADPNFDQLLVNGEETPVDNGTFRRRVPLLHEGTNAVSITALDIFSHRSDVDLHIVRDTIGPQLTITSPGDQTTLNSSSVTVTGTVDDTAVAVEINGIPAEMSGLQFSGTAPLNTDNAEIRAIAVDAAGNTTVAKVTVRSDRTPPLLRVDLPPDGYLTASPVVTVSGMVDDPAAEVTLNGEALVRDGAGAFTGTVTLDEGEHSLVIEARDPAGNVSSVARTVVVDATPPVIVITNPPNGDRTGSDTIDVRGHVDDTNAIISINGRSVANNEGNFVHTLDLPDNSGEVDVNVRATDPAGNTTLAAVTIARDSSPPVIAILSPDADAVIGADVIDVLGSTDDGTATIHVNGAAATVTGNRFAAPAIALVEGTNTITVTAVDDLDNTSEPVSITVVSDTEPPAEPELTDAPGIVNGGSVTLTGITEANATVTVNGGASPLTTAADPAGAFTATVLLAPDQSNTLRITATDRAGNASLPVHHHVVSDTRDPVVVMHYPVAGDVVTQPALPVVGLIEGNELIDAILVNEQAVTMNGDRTFFTLLLLDNGAQTVDVLVRDAAGNTTETETDIVVDTVEPDQDPPLIVLVSPSPNAAVPTATFDIIAVIVDQSAIETVTINGVDMDASTVLADNVLALAVTADENGDFTIAAADVHGHATVSTFRVTVDPDAPTPPMIELVQPGTIVNDPTVTIYARGEPGTRFVIEGGLAETSGDVPDTGVFIGETPLAENQVNDLQVFLVDAVGNTSAPATVSVRHDGIPPAVVDTVPPSGAVGVLADTAILIEFDEAVDAETLTDIAIASTSRGDIDWALAPCDPCVQISLTPTVPFDDSDEITVTVPATVTDVAGNPLTQSHTWQFQTIDTTAPTAPSFDGFTELPNQSLGAPKPKPIRSLDASPAFATRTKENPLILTGSAEPLGTLRITIDDQTIEEAIAHDGRFSVSLTLTENTENQISAVVTDPAGNPSPAIVLSVTHDNVAPLVIASDPADGAVDVSLDATLSITFNEAVDEATIDDAVRLGASGDFIGVTTTPCAACGSHVYTIVPDRALSGDTTYVLSISTDLRDLAGNALADPVTVTFQSRDVVAPAAPLINSPAATVTTNDADITLEGFAEPGSTVTVHGAAEDLVFDVDSTGLFSVIVPLNENSLNTFTLTATDAKGNSSPHGGPVRVRHDNVPPEVVLTVPEEGGTISTTRSIFIEFSEPVARESVTDAEAIEVLDRRNDAIAGRFGFSSSARSVTFFPTANLVTGESYGLVIDTAVTDLAGNHLESIVTVNFNAIDLDDTVDRPDAPVFSPRPPAETFEAGLTLTGTAEPSAVLHVLGGKQNVQTTVEDDGEFAIAAPLVPDHDNQLIAYVVNDTTVGKAARFTVRQQSRLPGIRIISPRPDTEYHGASITVLGIIDRAEDVESVLVNGEVPGRFQDYFALQIVCDEPGAQAVHVEALFADGSERTDTVSFFWQPQPEGDDVFAPVVAIAFPENGATVNRRYLEVMGTVEEGDALSSVMLDGAHAHMMIGNIFMIMAELQPDAPNDLEVTATDKTGLAGSDTVTVFVDDTAPPQPQVDELPQLTSDRVIAVSGTAEPGATVIIAGGATTVRGSAGGNGRYTIAVPLVPNGGNTLTIVSEDEAGNRSEPRNVSIAHDDTPPRVVRTHPASDAFGVAVDASISATFSERINPDSLTIGGSVTLTDGSGMPIEATLILSTDRTTLTIVPAFKLQRGDTVTVALGRGIADANGFTLPETYVFSFRTALYLTTVSGVVVDPNLQPVAGVTVGIADSGVSQVTGTFGTFILDEAPLGEQILFVDPTGLDDADSSTGSTVTEQYPYLEFRLNIIEDTDNTLGRPIFLTPADFSTATAIVADGAVIDFAGDADDLEGFSLSYDAGSARFDNGSSIGAVTATRILPEFIPDRLPGGAIPHFLVDIAPIRDAGMSESSAHELTFSPAASLTFPNVYGLAAGELVRVFHFQYGVHNLIELGEYPVDGDDLIRTGPILESSGFVGIVPADPAIDLTRSYLHGRVVGPDGSGIPGVMVNAIAGDTLAVTGEDGEYTIPMPDVRIFTIETYAMVRTNLGAGDDGSPTLVFKSPPTELNPSGITEIPDIVVDTFFLGGSIRFINDNGRKLPRAGLAFGNGLLASLDDRTARNVEVLVLRRLDDAGDGTLRWDSTPYARTRSTLAALETGYDAAFSVPIVAAMTGSDDPTVTDSSAPQSVAPKPGDVLKLVAFDQTSGFYGETELVIPPLSAQDDPDGDGGDAGATLDVLANIDLHPPRVTLDINRVFFIDGVRRRANVPANGIILTDDEFVEIKARWTTPEHVPLRLSGIDLHGRLQINSIGYQDDVYFNVLGGEQSYIIEIREALFPQRLQVLQRDTEVGTETIVFAPNASFAEESLMPASIRTNTFGILSDTDVSASTAPSRRTVLHVVDLDIEPASDGGFDVRGRSLPDQIVSVGNLAVVAGADGFFGGRINTAPPGGVPLRISNSISTLVGASFVPVLTAVDPAQGSQGEIVTISGENFSTVPEENNVKFNGAPATVVTATARELKVVVPDEATAGPVTVTVAGKTSNGLFFDFISVGIPNGSFETADFRGYERAGSAAVLRKLKHNAPTHGNYMAYLDTAHNPRDGVSTLTTDRFFVPGVFSNLTFDFRFLGTVIENGMDDYVEVWVVADDAETELAVFPSDFERIPQTVISGFAVGSGFRTTSADVSAYAGGNEPIRLRFVLKGRGAVSQDRPGILDDDDNPLSISDVQGTGLLLDNIRLSGGGALPQPLDLLGITTEDLDDAVSRISAGAGTLAEGSQVYVHGIQTGQRYEFAVGADGGFTLDVGRCVGQRTYYALYYGTPKTTTDNTSDRLYSPSVVLRID